MSTPDDSAPYRRRRRSGGLYPLWLGALALAGFTALWFSTADEPAASDGGPEPGAGSTDAGPTDAAPTDAEQAVEPTRLVWIVAPRPPMDAGVLDDCLATAGYERAAAVGLDPIVVTHPGRVRPITLRPTERDDQPAVELSTPVEADARLAATLHIAAAACLYVEGAQVYDPLLERTMTPVDWPQLGETGGLPLRHLIAVDDVPGGRVTRGLNRLGRPELALAVKPGADGATAWRFIRAYAAAAIVAPADATRLERDGDHPARLIDEAEARAAGWWTAPPAAVKRKVLASADESDARPLALPRQMPHRPPATREKPADTRPAPKPARAKPAPRPRPTRPPKPRPPAPFSPEYR